MVVYIELAFLENFCLDFLLLALTVLAVKAPVRIGRLLLAACVGGIFAILYPLLSIPSPLLVGLKLAVGLFLPLLVVGKGKWGAGGAFFFLLTFAFGGALLGGVQAAPKWVRFPVFFLLAACVAILIEKLYKRRSVFQYLYDCTLQIGGKKAKARGFLDSGNFATKRGLPVCFLSADIWYDLVGEELLLKGKGGGQGCDEMQIFTQAGVRSVPLRRGKLRIEDKGEICEREVYFAPSSNRIGREYKMILPSRILEEG